eukprot:3307171-Rhodomonas_salina.1
MKGRQRLLSGARVLVATLAPCGAAAAEPGDLARGGALEAVVVDDDRGAEQGHDENVVGEDDQGREHAEGARGRDWHEEHAQEGHAGRCARDRHGGTRLAPHPRHAGGEVAVHVGALVRRLAVRVHEYEDVIRADRAHNEDCESVKAAKVPDLENATKEKPRAGEGEDDFGHADACQEQRAEHVPE